MLIPLAMEFARRRRCLRRVSFGTLHFVINNSFFANFLDPYRPHANQFDED